MNWDLGSGRSHRVLSCSDCCFATCGEGDSEQLGATLTVFPSGPGPGQGALGLRPSDAELGVRVEGSRAPEGVWGSWIPARHLSGRRQIPEGGRKYICGLLLLGQSSA